MKPDETFAVRMSTAEWYSFARQHPEAAKLLFEKAALRQTEHMNKPGLDHKLKLLFNEGGYGDRVRDAKAVHAMAKDYDWTTPQKRMPPIVNVPYDPNAPTYESSIAGALKQRAAQQEDEIKVLQSLPIDYDTPKHHIGISSGLEAKHVDDAIQSLEVKGYVKQSMRGGDGQIPDTPHVRKTERGEKYLDSIFSPQYVSGVKQLVVEEQAKSYQPGVQAAVRPAYKPRGLGATYGASDAADEADPSFPFPQKARRRQKTAVEKGMSM